MARKEQMVIPHAESVWKEFISSGHLNKDVLRPEIRESWKRCRKMGINPYHDSSPTVLNKSQFTDLLSRKKDLLNIAIPFMKRLYDVISGSGFIVVLTDERGFILEIVSTPDLKKLIEERKVNYKPGVRWLEEDVGTNGIDLVLRHKKPFQIFGAEHYGYIHHESACIGAPIFNIDRQLTGALIATGFVNATHKHTAAMIVAAVEVISDEIMIREKNRQLSIINNRLANVLTSMSDGVIVTDKDGVIKQINPVATKMIGQPQENIVSGVIYNYFNDGFVFHNEVLGKGISYTDKEARIKSKEQLINILATANPIRDEQENIVGGIIVLTPAEKLRKLIKRYASTSARFHLKDIIGNSPAMKTALNLSERASKTSNNILLEGESGTGKEIFAQAIHNGSHRKNGPFVAINCGALPRELIASELFGYTEGSFTGARKEGKPGKFELADGGTIFLDEIAEMPLDLQVNLLRVLQERTVTRIGSINEIQIDVMIICASNRDLSLEVMRNNFRQDLYYRLNVISIKIPPLRDRLEDIPLLVDFFIKSMSNGQTGSTIKISPEVIECFKNYNWPGNVRELQNVVEKMLLSCNDGYLGLDQLPREIRSLPVVKSLTDSETRAGADFLNYARQSKKEKLHEYERSRMMMLLAQFGGNISKVAKELGINRCTVYKKMKRYNLA